MRIAVRRTLATAAATAAALAGTVIATAQPAAADPCQVTASVPNVKMVSPGKMVIAKLTQACGVANAAWLITAGGTEQNALGFGEDFEYSGLVGITDDMRLGVQKLVPAGAYDSTDVPLPQAAGSFDLRLGSAAKLTATRSGAYVTTTGTVTRYNKTRHKFAGWAAAKVEYQGRTSTTGTWTHLGSSVTSSTGAIPQHKWTAAISKNKYYRVIVSPTSVVWGVTGAAVKA